LVENEAMAEIKTSISIDQDLFEEADALAKEIGISCSRVVALALADFMRRTRNKKLQAQINAAYAGAFDAGDAANLGIIRSHQRKSGEDEEWK